MTVTAHLFSVEQIKGKYDANEEAQARAWINAVLPDAGLQVEADMTDFVEALKDGKILCNLINTLRPGSVKKINESKMAFKMVSYIL